MLIIEAAGANTAAVGVTGCCAAAVVAGKDDAGAAAAVVAGKGDAGAAAAVVTSKDGAGAVEAP